MNARKASPAPVPTAAARRQFAAERAEELAVDEHHYLWSGSRVQVVLEKAPHLDGWTGRIMVGSRVAVEASASACGPRRHARSIAVVLRALADCFDEFVPPAPPTVPFGSDGLL